MIPIHELLSRIRWDEEYGRADFIIGYYDRLADTIIHVPLQDISFDPEDHFDFFIRGEEGEMLSIPLHRVRQVFRNGKIVWERHGDTRV